MKNLFRRWFLLWAGLASVCSVGIATATSFVPVALEDLVRNSPAIVVGAFPSEAARRNVVGPGIRALWEGGLRVDEVLKGTPGQPLPPLLWHEPSTDGRAYRPGDVFIWILPAFSGSGPVELSHPALVRPLSERAAILELVGGAKNGASDGRPAGH